MKRILVIGSTGRIGRHLINELTQVNDIQVTAFSRRSSNQSVMVGKNLVAVKGDLADKEAMHTLIAEHDVVVVATAGDVLLQAQQLVSAMVDLSDKQIIWVTGLGIHKEVPGALGLMLNALAKMQPDYVTAADTIVNSGHNYVLLRCAALTDGDSVQFDITEEGEPIHQHDVSRRAVAKLIKQIISGERPVSEHTSWGVTK